MLVSLERKNNPLPESEKSSCCHRRLLRAFLGSLRRVLLDQFSVSSVKMSYPQVEADLKMQTNMPLRYPGGGPFLRSLPGIAANLSEVIHEPQRKSQSVPKSRAPDWHHPRTLPGAGSATPSTCPVLNSDEQIQQLGGLRTASHIVWDGKVIQVCRSDMSAFLIVPESKCHMS